MGTEGGAVYVYGDGFQYVRPWLTDDPNEVVSIIPLSPNRILVAFVDNSFAVMELPTLEVIDLLQPSWLSSRDGDLTAIYCDLPSGKNFVYMGTSEGYVHVLDVMEGSVRVCEFQLKPTDLGIAGQSMAISDIQTCPKDERYLAIACDGTSTDAGMLVVFDLSKHKIHKSFKTSAIANFVWHNSGDIIFASTRTGEIILMNVEKGSQAVVWNARSELIDDSEVDEEDGQGVVIRKLQWMAPQSDVTADAGCLFVLLSATNSNDNDNLNNVVLGFSVNYEKLETVFALPPVAGEKIASFRLVPAYDKKQRDESPDEFEVTPALLLLTQRGDIDISVERSLKIIRCPTTPVSNWGLEIGALPDPRLATEVQPSTSTITVRF